VSINIYNPVTFCSVDITMTQENPDELVPQKLTQISYGPSHPLHLVVKSDSPCLNLPLCKGLSTKKCRDW